MERGCSARTASKLWVLLLPHSPLPTQGLPGIEITGKNSILGGDRPISVAKFVALAKLFSLSFLIYVMGTLNIHWKDWWSWSSNTLATWCELIGKDPDAGKDWRQEKGATEDEKIGWHHQLNWHEFQQTPGDSKGQGSLACGSPWGCKELDTTERLNNKVYKSWGDCILQENPIFRQFYGLSSKT